MNKNTLLFIAAVAAFFAMAGYLAFSGGKKETPATPAVPVAATSPAGGHVMVETRPLQPPSKYEGRAAAAYRIAAEIPGVLDQLYCYCKCKENPRFLHKTLLTCYTDDHAANCGSCMQEAEMASQMTKEGKSPAEIQAAIDKYYQEQDTYYQEQGQHDH